MSAQPSTVVSEDALRRFCRAVLETAGMPARDSSTVTDVLVDSDLRGVSTHGVTLLPRYAKGLSTGVFNPSPTMSVVRERTSVSIMDGDNGLGHVVAVAGMEKAMERSHATGIAVVATRNSNHFGPAGFYAEMAAKVGMIGMVISNAPVVMAAWGGGEAVIGNNPIAFSVPLDGRAPIVLDMACSVRAKGAIRMAAEADGVIPAGWALNAQGAPTTNAMQALAGSMLPVGEHKGSGLAIVGELLAGALPLANCCLRLSNDDVTMGGDKITPWGVGHWLMALDIDAFADRDAFSERASTIVDSVLNSKLAVGSDRISLPGELENELRIERRAAGIPLESRVIRRLQNLGEEFQIELHL